MKERIFVGIDPGTGGGIATLFVGGEGVEPKLFPMPATEEEIAELLNRLIEEAGWECIEVLPCVEEVPKFTGRLIPASTLAVLFRNLGFCLGVLRATPNVGISMVKPQDWQSAYPVGKRRECKNDNEWKNRLKSEAQRLYPNTKVTLKTADALLIAHYHMTKTLTNP